MMEFISTKNMKNEDAPEGKVLAKFLEPGWGGYSIEFTIEYFDNPDDYEDNDGNGWCDWKTSHKINVISYSELPDNIEPSYPLPTQKGFMAKHGEWHPNLGNAGI